MGENLRDLGLGRVPRVDIKSQSIKGEKISWTLSKFKICSAKDHVKKDGKTIQTGRKIFATTCLTKDCYLEYEELSKLNSKNNNPIQNWQKTGRDISLKRIYRWHISTKKHV